MKNQTSPSPESPSPQKPVLTPPPTVTPVEVADPTASQAPNGDLANWKTYTDAKYFYSLKYPSSHKQTSYREGNFEGIQISAAINGSSLSNGVMVKTLAITNVSSPKAFSEEQWQKDQNQPDLTTIGSITPIKEITIDGRAGYTYEVSFMGKVKVIIVPLLDNSVLRIAGYYAGSEDKLPSYKKIIDQILSTFRFLDK